MYPNITPIINTLVYHIAGENNELAIEEVQTTLLAFAEEIKAQAIYEIRKSEKFELRDQFATSIVNALLQKSNNVYYEGIANSAYNIADAMLEARKQNLT